LRLAVVYLYDSSTKFGVVLWLLAVFKLAGTLGLARLVTDWLNSTTSQVAGRDCFGSGVARQAAGSVELASK